jgi:diguanylate cyclase (GGDEF)-like protein/PAS domain S-box-containing protein
LGSGSLFALTLLTAAALLALGLAVVVRARASLISHLFFAICAGAAGWLFSFSRLYRVMDPRLALEWARIGMLFTCIIPASIFHFTIVYLGRTQEKRRDIIVAWIICLIVGALGVTPLVTSGVRRFSWGFYPAGSLFNLAWLSIYLGIIAASVLLLARASRGADDEARRRARGLVAAFIAGSFAAIDFFPSIGIAIPPLGFLAVIAFIGIAAHSIWRYPLADITPEYAASQILATMKGAVIVVDLKARIRLMNDAAAKMLGYEERELLGEHLRVIFEPSKDTLTTGQLVHSLGVLEHNMHWRQRDGTTIDVTASSSFLRGADDAPVGVVYVAQDVTERKRADQALRESERRYRTLFDGNPLPMWVYDTESLEFIAVNEAAIRHYGFSRNEFMKMHITDIRPPEDIEIALQAIRDARERTAPRVFRHLKKGGAIFDAEVTSYEFTSEGKRARLVIAVDVTERRRAEEALRESEERYRLLFERNLAAVFRSTREGSILDCNEAMARLFGYETRAEMLDTKAGTLYFAAEDRDSLLEKVYAEGSLSNVEVRLRKKDGTQLWALENITVVGGGVMEGTLIDITERKTTQERMEYQAYHDVLTGLPNRSLFRDRINMALAHARRAKRGAAVMFLDLDQFKLVNDTLGHTVGDGLLQQIASRIVHCVRGEDTVARMGGDEFTILLADISDTRSAAMVAQKVLAVVSHPVVVDGHELFATTSIGIAIFPDDGGDAETLLKNADRAMYRAKEAGRNNYQFATPSAFDVGRLELERSLHHAFEREEFILHYQPMVELESGRVVGAEALIRWNHPEHGLMNPDDFIPVAEECGLIIPIGEWVLRTACAQMKRWHDAGHGPLRIAVNLSARQFQQRDLPATIERVLESTSFPGEMLDVEITESTAMQNAELSLSIMRRLKEMGVRISIDDFGTGYSSLSYLKRFPIDCVKIDQGFVRDLGTGTSEGAIITAVISLARALQLRVVAEGVETEEQLQFLQRERCAEIQGFLYSRPVCAEEFEATLAKV